jgi:cytochrome o ubiquinol oxidase subunit 2
VRAVSPARFGSWLAAVRGTGAVLDSESYRRLAQQNTIDAPYTYGAVQPDLFNAVVMRRLAPGPGPQ